MKIERSTFLLLATSIATMAGGCTIVQQTTPSPADSGVPTDTATASDGTGADVADGAASDSAADADGTAATDAADASETPSCDDSVGTPGDCTTMAPSDEGTCGSDLFARTRCDEDKTNYKPAVAQSAVACLLKLTSIQVCNATLVYKCGHDALMAACADPTTSAPCTEIIAGCTEAGVAPTMAECQQELAGMTATARDKMVTCMKTSCVTTGLYGCEEGL